jgi:hypothetical protein
LEIAMAALETVQAYLDRARTLLQDKLAPYRYSDDEYVQALNLAVLEVRRLRPDLMRDFFRAENGLPEYFSTPAAKLTEKVAIDPMYRVAVLYYLCGHIQLQDEEDVTDARAAGFINKFNQHLLSLSA